MCLKIDLANVSWNKFGIVLKNSKNVFSRMFFYRILTIFSKIIFEKLLKMFSKKFFKKWFFLEKISFGNIPNLLLIVSWIS